jgi:hypothetical protein
MCVKITKKKVSYETFSVGCMINIHPRSKDNLRLLDNQAKFLP